MEDLYTKVRLLMPFRSYRGSRRRSGMRPVIQSYKKVINVAPASYTAGFQNVLFAKGTDSVAQGQTSASDNAVVTGSLVKFVEVQFACVNLAAAAAFITPSLQYVLSGQTTIDPRSVGGSPQRNQVLFQTCLASGESQSVNRVFKFKIPKKFQRLKEGMEWGFVWANSATVTAVIQIVYKTYR